MEMSTVTKVNFRLLLGLKLPNAVDGESKEKR